MFRISKIIDLLNFLIAFLLFIIVLPIIIIFSFLIYFEDKSNPIYFGKRVGKNFKNFNLFKLRSMKINKEVGFQSTSVNDKRILKIGRFIRSTKIDELPQILNILLGNINFVGPRPNVEDEVNKYVQLELRLLNLKPGITDFSSIIFSDEGQILSNSKDPDLDYNLLIRPRKNILALLYFQDRSILSDFYIIVLTVLNVFNRKLTLSLIYKFMKKKYRNHDLKFILRDQDLIKIENIDEYFKKYEDQLF
jgi:lipopolysaccharide/colanic/teichoic acid biosynthesis glycosyltransferase